MDIKEILHKIPEEILNFYKQQGYNEISVSDSGWIWVEKRDLNLSSALSSAKQQIAYIEYSDNIIYYININSKKLLFSKEEMLKIIKLKAFL